MGMTRHGIPASVHRRLRRALPLLASLSWAACSGGTGVVLTGQVAASGGARAAGIGSYDIAPTSDGYQAIVYDVEGLGIGQARIEARLEEGLVFSFEPVAGSGFEAGTARAVLHGDPVGAAETVRVTLEVPEMRAPRRTLRLDLLATWPTGASGSRPPELMLYGPVPNNADAPPAQGGTFADLSGIWRAVLPLVEDGRAADADVSAWVTALGYGPTWDNVSFRVLLGLVFDRRLHAAVHEEARDLVEQAFEDTQGTASGTVASAMHLTPECEELDGAVDCYAECRKGGKHDWIGLVRQECLSCMTLAMGNLQRLDRCQRARKQAVDDGWCKTMFTGCEWGLRPVASPDGHGCQCACVAANCDSFCGSIERFLDLQRSGLASCSDDLLECRCPIDPVAYCQRTWGDAVCSEGLYVESIQAFDCDTAGCGDGWRTTSCAWNPDLIEPCDESSDAGDTDCGSGFECVGCECVPCGESARCGDGRVTANCPGANEECDPENDRVACPDGTTCVGCRCIGDDRIWTPDASVGTDVGGSGIPAICQQMLACAASAAPEQYARLYETFGPGGSCYVAIGRPAGSCEATCAEAVQAWQEDDAC